MDFFKFSLTNEQAVLVGYSLECTLNNVTDRLIFMEGKFYNDKYGIIKSYQSLRSDLQSLLLELHVQSSAFLNAHGLKSFNDGDSNL